MCFLYSSLYQSDRDQETPPALKKRRGNPDKNMVSVASVVPVLPVPVKRNSDRNSTRLTQGNAALARPPMVHRSRPRRSPSSSPRPSSSAFRGKISRDVGRASFNLSRTAPPKAAQAPLDTAQAPPDLDTAQAPPDTAQAPPNGVHVPTLTNRIIRDLCSILREAPAAHSCLGMLITKENICHRVWVPKQSFSLSKPAETVTLAHLLTLPEPPKKERLILGVKLASSVMQLHGTEWLREQWGKHDIFFVQEESDDRRAPVLATPLVHRAFISDGPIHQGSTESRVIWCNRSLFSLGIILAELWFWKSLESFQAQFGTEGGTAGMVEYCTAVRLIDDLYLDAGGTYGDIVRRCIAGLDHRETQLEKDQFKNEVYLKVLLPLEEHLKVFCNEESLAEIFGKEVC